jgi:RND family efflux transporter MFP subunit
VARFKAGACGPMALLVALVACGKSAKQSEVRETAPARAASVAADRLDAGKRDTGWVGVVLSRQNLDLAPEIAGQVDEIYVHEGDTVRRGQTVAVLGATHDRQEMAMAEVNLRAAEADISRSRLELADAENRLANRLTMPEAFPKEEIRRTEIQKQIAEVDLESAQARAAVQRARVAQARDRLAKAELRAPSDGKVARRYMDPGALAGPGQPVVRLIGDGSMIVRFAAPPEEARSLRAAARLGISTGDANVPAVIESVSPEVDPPSGLVIVVAALDPVAQVKPGSVVRVHPAPADAVRGKGAT